MSINKLILFLFFQMNVAFAEVLSIDISGQSGMPPVDGACCDNMSPTSNPNQNPRDGDDARPGTLGANANNLDLELEDNGRLNGQIIVYGTVYNSNNGRVRSNINDTISLTSSIFVNAEGGDGARGGIGGQGQDGCEGRDGSDATETRNGQDGTDGCDSGNGGDASVAQDGGVGGQVRVIIPADQTHLALLVSADIEGGNGGASGRPGQPGRPGQGGDGGDSKTYVDYWVDEPACPPPPSSSGGGYDGGGNYSPGGGSNDLGNGYNSFESNAAPHLLEILKGTTQIAGDILNELIGVSPAYACGGRNPVYATNAGGDDGSDGQSGSVGRGDTSPGQDGDDGKFEFIVVEPNGRETVYRRPFDLQLLSYDLRDSAPGGNEDGIFEPNEILTISRIRIKNVAQMPSPRMTDVILSIQTSNWLIANPVDKVVVPSLNGGQEITLPNRFQVQVRNTFTAGQSESWSVSDTIVPRGSVPRIQRTLGGLALPKTVHMSFPVEITPIQSVSVIGPGETAAIQWRVTNTSAGNFIGLNGAIRRLQTTLRRVGGDAPQNTIANISIAGDENGSLAGYLRTITELRSNESVIISGQINFSSEAQPYTYVDIQTSLGLEIFGTGEMSTIMTQGHRISISQTYRYTPGASVLLLTHSSITREEYSAWMAVFENLGLKADVWDISYNRDLNLVKDLQDNQGHSLMKNYAGKTIVLLNGPLSDNRNLEAMRLLNRSQFYQAALENNINFYVLGGDQESLFSQLVGMHLSPNALEQTAVNKESFLRHVESQEISSAPISIANPDQLTYQELQKRLRQFPAANHSLIFTDSGSNRTRLTLYPSLSQLSGSMIAQPATVREKASLSFIRSSKNLRPFLLSLSLNDKIKSYKSILKSGDRLYLPFITSALIHDLIEVSYVYKTTDTKKAEQLEKLQAFAESILMSEVHGNSKEQLGRVVAAIAFFAQASSDNALVSYSNQLVNKLDDPTKTFYRTFLESFKQFSSRRETALRVNFEKTFDTYKMFTLPAIGRAITSSNTLFIKSSVVIKGDL